MARTVQSPADFNGSSINGATMVNATSLSLPKLVGPNDSLRIWARFVGTGAAIEVKFGTVVVGSYPTLSVERSDELTLIVSGANDALIFGDTDDGFMVEDTTNDYTTVAVALTVTGAQAGSVYLAYGI